MKNNKKYTTKLGNTYNLDLYIDCDMPYGDYKELNEEGANLCVTLDGRCGTEFDIKDTDIITVCQVLNLENEQKLIYAYIPLDEIADYELEIQKKQSNFYTDYSRTLADALAEAENDKEIEEIEERLEYEDDKEIIIELKDELEDKKYYQNQRIEEVKSKIKELEDKCIWNSWDL